MSFIVHGISNGSLDAQRPVAGVAMGLLLPDALKKGDSSAQDDEAVILTDILGLEDGLGTMDFKVMSLKNTALCTLYTSANAIWHVALSLLRPPHSARRRLRIEHNLLGRLAM